MSVIDDVRLVLAPPHPAGRPFIFGGVAVVLLGLVLGWWWLASFFPLFCVSFFRAPERVPPGRPAAILAPADGRVVAVSPAVPPPELGLGPAPRWRVAIFLSV